MSTYSDLFKPGQPLELFKDWPAPITASSLVQQWLSALRDVTVPSAWHLSHRTYHEDLAAMTDQQLWQQKERARFLLVWLDKPDEWLADRVRAVQAEEAQRKGGQR